MYFCASLTGSDGVDDTPACGLGAGAGFLGFGGGAGVVSLASGADSLAGSFAASAGAAAAESGEAFEVSLEALVASPVAGAALAGGFPPSGVDAGLVAAGGADVEEESGAGCCGAPCAAGAAGVVFDGVADAPAGALASGDGAVAGEAVSVPSEFCAVAAGLLGLKCSQGIP